MATREIAYKYMRKYRPTLFDSGIGARLPEAYRKFYDEWRNTPPKPVHYIPPEKKDWVRNMRTGEVKRIEEVPLPCKFPPELEYVFTGGETVIQGFLKRTDKKHIYTNRVPHFWVPVLYKSVVYTEILDKYLSTSLTKRVIELIHEHEGFDNYLLQTKACDLKNLVALKLKQRLLHALNTQDLPYDEEKNNEIFQKYKEYLIPPEEIEWYGLTFTEACNKLKEIEAQKMEQKTPLKHVFRAELIQQLKESKNLPKEEETENKSMKWLPKKLPGVSIFNKDKQ